MKNALGVFAKWGRLLSSKANLSQLVLEKQSTLTKPRVIGIWQTFQC